MLFGTKPQLLRVVIDVAIAGDDEPVAVLSRSWTIDAQRTTTAAGFLAVVGPVLREAQARSSGVMLAAYEAASGDPAIQTLIREQERQRQGTASWIVDGVIARATLRPGLDRAAAIDIVWLMMDPVVFSRLTRQRRWRPQKYESWFADSVVRLLVNSTDDTEDPS